MGVKKHLREFQYQTSKAYNGFLQYGTPAPNQIGYGIPEKPYSFPKVGDPCASGPTEYLPPVGALPNQAKKHQDLAFWPIYTIS
jgi:hypothetical protein